MTNSVPQSANPSDGTQRRRGNRSRSAFTIIELLVVVCVIVSILIMLIPSVLQARLAARRAQCKNNLRQISLAFQNYVGMREVLPPGYVHRGDPATGENMAGFGWAAMLLPFTDNAPLFESFEFDAALWQAENVQASSQQVTIFVCPSDIASGFKSVGVGTSQFAMASYAASFGPGDLNADPGNRRGVFSRNSATRLQQIPDGLSNTLFVCERQNGPLRQPGEDFSQSESDVVFETTWAGAVRNFNNPDDDQARFVLFRSGHVPGSMDSDENDASTPHVGGFHVTFGDGGVRFLNSKIDLELFQELSTRNSGEMLPNF